MFGMFLYWLYGLCYQLCSVSRKPEHMHMFLKNFLTDEQATGTPPPPPPLIAAAAGGRGDTLIHLGFISLVFYLLSFFFHSGLFRLSYFLIWLSHGGPSLPDGEPVGHDAASRGGG